MNCGVCLREAPEPFLKIFDSNGVGQNIANILRQHFQFLKLPPDDEHIYSVICRYCWLKVKDFHAFYVTTEQTHLELTNTSTASIKDDHNTKDPICLNSFCDIKEEFVENWPEQILLAERETEEKATDCNDTNPLYEPEVLECLNKVLTSVINDTEVVANENKNKAEPKIIRKKKWPIEELEANLLEEKDKCKRQKRQQISHLDDEIVKKHIPMGCDLCSFVGEDFMAMTRHFRSQHKEVNPYIMCCNRKLSKRFLLVQHAYKHQDPEYFKCKDCQKIFSDGYILRSHIMAYHATEEDLKFMCDQCPKRFSRLYLLELHKPSHIPVNERRFMCDKCVESKTFASEHLLQMHIKMRHTKATNVCHVCAKGIRDKQAFEKHVRLHFEDSGPRVKCPRSNCDRWLKDEDNLKQHLRRHNDEGKVFTCDECGKICKNHRALKSHFNYTHSNEVFTCSECYKTFKKALSLKEHMAQHTGLSLYKCPFCQRTFNSNANMHSHKKRMHPAEWENWRRTKRGSSQKTICSDFGP